VSGGRRADDAGGRDPSRGRRSESRDDSHRKGLPRRLGDIITPALDRLAGGDEARAYAAWARAVGEPVSAGTRPKAFRRGQLTVECASSVWAHELTYLGPQILRRMDEVAPGHPVERFRFVVGRLPARGSQDEVDSGDVGQGAPGAGEAGVTCSDALSAGDAPTPAPVQGSAPSAAKEKRRRERLASGVHDPARDQAEGVDDGRLRAAIEAALRRSSEGPPGAPGQGTPSS